MASEQETLREGAVLGVFWHPACERHCIKDHPEQPARVLGILDALRKEWPPDVFREVSSPAKDEQLLLFHTPAHVRKFNEKADLCEQNPGRVVPYDSDTNVMRHTRSAAYFAAGAMVEAVDAVYRPLNDPKRLTTVFCCVRPPGHHAERNAAMGFCFFSNAAIGAKYAQQKYGVGKVAVLDFDVHHGNGTEEGFLPDETLFYGSTHEKDNYPGTGREPKPEHKLLPVNRRIVNRYLDTRHRLSTREQFRIKWRQVVDEMVLFQPDLVIFSAGFDAHDEDPLASCELVEEDFTWATDIVLEACVLINPAQPPPCLSILEGGYDIPALAASAVAHVAALAKGYPVEVSKPKTVSPPCMPDEPRAVELASQGSSTSTPTSPATPKWAPGDEAAALAAYLAELDLGPLPPPAAATAAAAVADAAPATSASTTTAPPAPAPADKPDGEHTTEPEKPEP